MELTDNEKDMLQAYLLDYIHAKEIANRLEYALKNLQKMSLYARGLSSESHMINDKFVIEEIKKDKLPE